MAETFLAVHDFAVMDRRSNNIILQIYVNKCDWKEKILESQLCYPGDTISSDLLFTAAAKAILSKRRGREKKEIFIASQIMPYFEPFINLPCSVVVEKFC